jgi:hypothetical protein
MVLLYTGLVAEAEVLKVQVRQLVPVASEEAEAEVACGQMAELQEPEAVLL